MKLQILPARLRFLKDLKSKRFYILDVGAGSHSASITKQYFPDCVYHGIDIANYQNSDEDFAAMDRFFEMDATKLEFDAIPEGFYDVILMSHIIEHLHNGDKVIAALIKKLKLRGRIYIEYPGVKSTKLPSMKGSLNFYDDPTHVRVYSISEIINVVESDGCKVIKSGTRRYWPYIVLMPIKVVIGVLKKGYFEGGYFWDLLGFAEYVYAKKTK